MSKSRSSGVLDIEVTNTVTGESWMKTYIECLDDKDKVKIVFYDSTNICFVDGKTVPATKNVDIPVVIGNNHITLNTDVIPKDIRLLLSRKVVKTANMTLDFQNDSFEPEQFYKIWALFNFN